MQIRKGFDSLIIWISSNLILSLHCISALKDSIFWILPDRFGKILIKNLGFEKIESETQKGYGCRSALTCICGLLSEPPTCWGLNKVDHLVWVHIDKFILKDLI